MTTDTDAPDEFEVPHLKDRLWNELAKLHAEHQRSRPAAPKGVPELARWRSRRSLVAAGVSAAAATALVVGVVTAQLVGTDSDRSADTASGGPLMERIVAATDEAFADSIVHTVDKQPLPGEAERARVLELWTDETSDATRILHRNAQGDPAFFTSPLTGPTAESPSHSGQRMVSYCTRQYIEIPDPGEASIDLPADTDRLTQRLRDDLSAGRLVEDGTEVVDGRELIRLVWAEGEPAAGDVLLVDPDTFLPVKMRGTLSFGETFNQTIEYLPRTPENLALINPPIPDGFTRVEPPVGQDFFQCGLPPFTAP